MTQPATASLPARRLRRGTPAATLGWVLAAATLSLTACGTAPESAEAPSPTAGVNVAHVQPLRILKNVAANDRGPEMFTLAVVNDQDQLEAMLPDNTKLTPDFEQHSVIVLGMGTQPTAGYAIRITGLQEVGGEQGSTVFVQAQAVQPDDAEGVAQQQTRPYAAVQTAKLGDDVTLRSDIR